MYSCAEGIRDHGGLRTIVPCVAALAALAGVTGCAQQPPPQQPTPPPMVIDEAMQRRDWEPSVAYIPGGNVLAGVNRFPLRSPGSYSGAATPDYSGAALDYLAHLGQTVVLPFTYVLVPPFEPQLYSDEEIGPSHTGMPAMRPDVRVPRQVDDVRVDPETLEVLPQAETEQQMEQHRRRGPLGPGDSEFMSSPPSPARQ